jgi:hypothetical protein
VNRTWIVGLVLIAVVVGAAACKRDKVPIVRLKDTEGRKLLARCTDRGCEFRQKGGPQWPEGKTDLIQKCTGLLVTICSVDPGTTSTDDVRLCRALECADDRECPPEPGAEAGHCINGLCVDPAGDLSPEDSIVLCLAGKGLGTGSDEQIEARALGLNCGSPCVVPKTCRQP